MKKPFLLILLICVLLGCKEKAEQKSSRSDTAALSKTIQVDSTRTVSLTPDALQEVSQWLAYVTAQNGIEDLKTATGYEIMTTSEPLVEIMESLSSTLPDTLKIPPVQARTTVLLTKSKVLHQLSSKKEKDPKEIFEAASDLIMEFDNLKIQLNERFLKTPEDFELALDREFEENQDSVQEAEEERADEIRSPQDSI